MNGSKREFKFLLNQAQRDSGPEIHLQEVLVDWGKITHILSERKRRPGMKRYHVQSGSDLDFNTCPRLWGISSGGTLSTG